jgi:molybdopterin-guanine dinucleotide biosynthesis protein A
MVTSGTAAPGQPATDPGLSAAGQVTPPRFDTIILAGGRGRRLGGADKPGLMVGRATLAWRAAAAAAQAGTWLIVLVGPERAELVPVAATLPGGLITVREQPPGAGPVPALRCGLARANSPWCAVIAADLPFLRGIHLRALLGKAVQQAPGAALAGGSADRLAGASGAVLADDDGRPQWLTGCWPTGPLRTALAAYQGTSLRGLMEPLHPLRLRPDVGDGQPPPWLDCDCPADLELARRLQVGPGRGPSEGNTDEHAPELDRGSLRRARHRPRTR